MAALTRPPGAVPEIVLLGAGHAHLHVLRQWQASGRANARVTCISDFPSAVYSGLLPAVLAGQLPASAMEIPLAALCRMAGATLVVDRVNGVDIRGRSLALSSGRVVRFDALSIGVGSVPRFDGVDVSPDAPIISIKPMQTLLLRLRDACRQVAVKRPGLVKVVTVGGGAGGVEVSLCAPRFLESVLGRERSIELSLVTAGPVVPGGCPGLVRRVRDALDRAGVRVVADRRVVDVRAEHVTLDDGAHIGADLVLWATGAAPSPVLAAMDVAKDTAGFLATTASLQSVSNAAVFVAGDAGSHELRPTPKAGVYAVRHGPVLLDNLRRVIAGRLPRDFVPQRRFMKLLNTGDGRAIGEWRDLSFEGAWVWRLKMAIDQRFVERYQVGRS